MTFKEFSESLRAQGYPHSRFAEGAALCDEADLILFAKFADRTVDKIIQLRVKYRISFSDTPIPEEATKEYFEHSVWPHITEEQFDRIIERFNKVVGYDFEDGKE